MNKYKNSAIAVMVTGMLALALVGCEKKEGPAEKAGKQVDQTMSKAGEKIEQAGEKIEGAAKDAQK